MGEQEKATAVAFFEAQDRLRGGPDPELCADGYTAHLAGHPPMDLAGHTGFAAAFYGAVPDLRHHVEEVLSDGDRVTVRFRLQGTNDGAFMDNPPSGNPVDVGAVVLMTIASGKVTEARGEFDELGFMQQIGVLPSS